MQIFTFIMLLTSISVCYEQNIQPMVISTNKISFNEILTKINHVFSQNNVNDLSVVFTNETITELLQDNFTINILTIVSNLCLNHTISFKKYTEEGLSNKYILFTGNKPYMLMDVRDSCCYFICLTLQPSVEIEFIKRFGTFDIDIFMMHNVLYFWNHTKKEFEIFSFENLQTYDWYNSLLDLSFIETIAINNLFLNPLLINLPMLLNYCNFLLCNKLNTY